MDRDALETRLKELQAMQATEYAAVRQHQANAQLLEGALQDCHYWLGQIAGREAAGDLSAGRNGVLAASEN